VGNIAFGSRLSDDGQHLEPEPAEQAALAEIRLLRNRGLTLRGIAAALNHRSYENSCNFGLLIIWIRPAA
jgi:hypothetical protein